MPPPLDVALLSPCFWPEVRRGGERFVRELADGLLEEGQCPLLITSHPGRRSRGVEDGLPVTRVWRPPQGRLLRRGFLPYLTHVPLTRFELRRSHCDLAHAVYPTDALATLGGRVPAVFSYLGIPDAPGLAEHRLGRRVMEGAVRGADVCVALSRCAADAFRQTLGVEAEVIPPGVDLEAFGPAAQRAPVPTIVCSAAPEVPRKHVGLLVRAFAELRRSVPDARLILSGPPQPGAAAAAGVPLRAPGVEWRVLDDTAVLARTLGEAWVAVLPSVSEAFGLVLVEALACGTPVVGYADAAIPELIDRPGIGTLFARLEPWTLAAALSDTLTLSRDPQVAPRCRRRAEEFSRARFTQRYLDLYRQLV